MRTHGRYLKHIGVLIAAGALAAGAVTASASAAPASPPRKAPVTSTTVDDTASRGTNRFTWSGRWWVCERCDRTALGRSFHYTNRPGARMTLDFTGTQATLYGFTQRAGGMAAVSLDGHRATVINLASSGHRSYTAIYRTPVLRDGRHTLTLTVLRRTTGSGRTVSIDKAIVVRKAPDRRPEPRPTATTPTTAPTTAPTTTAPRPTRPTPTTTTPTTTTPTTPTTQPTGQGGGVASITLDDGKLSQYANARPVLNAAGVKATFYIISDGLTWGSGSMSAAEARQLVSDGHEIGNHSKTHANLTSPGVDLETELGASNAAIRDAVGVTPTTCAYPYGQSNDAVRAVAAKYFRACRGTNGGTNAWSGLDRYDLRTYYVTTSTTPAQVQAAARSALTSGSWIIFVYHGVGTVGSSDDVTTQSFSDQLQAIRGTGIPIRTVSQAIGG